jgi:hypothetical protein
MTAITIEHLERAIYLVAQAMVDHDFPLRPTIRQLEAERNKLLSKTSDMDYAKAILARNGSNKGSNIPASGHPK